MRLARAIFSDDDIQVFAKFEIGFGEDRKVLDA
jgi:hypothetical protein